MFRFFRRIRIDLLSENKFSKYLLYALGEIILVVLGILIALQINNWNEQRKESVAIYNVLIEIKEDLLQDQIDLRRSLAQHNIDYVSQARIIHVLEKSKPFNDTIRADLGRIHMARNFFSASKGYELLKELNLGTLKDKKLRILLTKYYERDIPHVYRELADDKLAFENFWLPYVRQHFKDWQIGIYGVPHDYSNMLNDKRLLTATKMNNYNRSNTIEAYEIALTTSAALIPRLPDEN